MMTFDQFRLTRTPCDDLGAALDDCRWEAENPARGWLYVGCLFIEANPAGGFSLPIGNVEHQGSAIEPLEVILYRFACDEGYCDDTTPQKGKPMFRLQLDTDNAAFEGEDKAPEIARILKVLASKIEHHGETAGAVHDVNGNAVGKYRLTE